MNIKDWLSNLKREGDLLVGELPVVFLGKEETVEICFVQNESLPTAVQIETLKIFVSRQNEILEEVKEAIFVEYKSQNEEYRLAITGWGENADEFAPKIEKSYQLSELLTLQSLFIQDSTQVGEFGLGFWAKWEREHGVGVKYTDWQISEIGENSVHFQ